MAKLTIFLVAALFATTIAVDISAERQQFIQKVVARVKTALTEAAQAVQDAPVDTVYDKFSLLNLANEYSNGLQQIVYNLEYALQNSKEEADQATIREKARVVIKKLSENSYYVQQAFDRAPAELKTALKTKIQELAADSDKLYEIYQNWKESQQIEQTQPSQRRQEVRRALVTLYAVVQRIKVEAEIRKKSPQDVLALIKDVVAKLTTAFQNYKADQPEKAQILVQYAHQVARLIGKIINKVQRCVSNPARAQELRTIGQQVVHKLSEIRANLDQADVTQAENLKTQFKTYIGSHATQVEKLVQMLNSNLSSEDKQYLISRVKSVMGDVLAGVRTLHSEIELDEQKA